MYNCGEDCKFDRNINRDHLLHHIKNKIPTKIHCSQTHLLPRRADFVHPRLGPAFAANANAGLPIIFMPTSVCEKSDWVDGVMKYRVYLFGTLPCGSKTCVILDNIPVHVDVFVPPDMKSSEFDDFLRGQLIGKNITFTGLTTVQSYKLHGFQEEKSPCKRISFNNLRERSDCIEFLTELSKNRKAAGKSRLETAADDTGRDNYYYPKVAREYKFATADWNRFEKYEVLTNVTTNCTHTFRVDIANYKKLNKARRAELQKPGSILAKILDRDPTMTAMWDIETHRTVQNGLVPTPTDTDYTIFMICSGYFPHHTDESLVEVCVVDVAANARKGISLVIECGTEINVLKTHAEIMGNMAPDVLGAFNGGTFDWPLTREKYRRYGLLTFLKSKLSSLLPSKGRYADTEQSVLRWSFRKEKIKIDATTDHELPCVADFPGILDTDAMPVFLKMYPRAEVRKSASLNFFLAKNGLESKEDMPYKRMFRIYERALKLATIKSCHCGTAQQHCECCKDKIRELDFKPIPGSDNMDGVEYSHELYADLIHNGAEKCCYCGKKPRNLADMADVGYYCVIDCLRPQQLYVKRTIIPDKRELSTMSYVSLYDSFYRADGMKVCNLIGAYSQKMDIAFSNAQSDKSNSEKDHYPGAWVFPPNRGLHSDGWVNVETTLSDGTKLKRRMRCRPITGLDFASLYPSLMMAYNLSTDSIVRTREHAEALAKRGYSIHHIAPFDYERGEKKGNVGNQKLVGEGWTVRHNGVFSKKHNAIVTKYTKCEEFTFTVNGKTETLKQECDAPIHIERLDALRADGVKIGRRVKYEPTYGRAPLPGERMGIFPYIVKKLFDKRVPIKAEFVRLSKLKEEMDAQDAKVTIVNGVEITYDDVEFMLNKVESKQKALKILANTFYGKSGDFRAPIYELLVAAGITCAGQMNIKLVDGFVRKKGFTTHYGDSVTGDTPIMCKIDNIICYRTIEELNTNWAQYGDKEAGTVNMSVWTERGWTKINRVIRHYTDKPIYRVLTHTGCVDVTSDHSLLNENAEKIKPTDVKVGTKLLHHDLPCDIDVPVTCNKNIYLRGKLAAAIVYKSLASVYNNVTIENNGDDSYQLTINDVVTNSNIVKKITCLGSTPQYVYDLETENHHFAAGIGRMIVHNTDSLYISCPDNVYEKCDAEYDAAIATLEIEFAGVAKSPEPTDPREIEYKKRRVALRVKWWDAQVAITMGVMSKLKEEVSDFLLDANGTLFLNMAYEEVGFPTVFCGKKKYFMTPHIEKINFFPKDIFIRGIDIVKQGQAKISKQLGDEFMREALSPENERDLIDIAEDKIRKFYKTKLDPTLFALSARYKPNKKNVPVHTFVSRMVEMRKKYADDPLLYALYEPPEAGDKFEYVIVKKDQRFTLQGTKIEIKKGHQMEYVRTYRASQVTANPMELDLNYYMKNSIVGLFARFIAGHSSFQPPDGMYDVSIGDQYSALDTYCIDRASKFLEELCDSITGVNKAETAQLGRDYRAIYKNANKQIRADIMSRYGTAAYVIHELDIHTDDDRAQSTRLIEQLKLLATELSSDHTANTVGKDYIKLNNKLNEHRPDDKKLTLFQLKRAFNSDRDTNISRTRVAICARKEAQIIEKLYNVIPKVITTLHKYERTFVDLIDDMRKVKAGSEIIVDNHELDSLNNLIDGERESILKVHDLMLDLIAVYKVRANVLSIVGAIEEARADAANIAIEPTMNIPTTARNEAKRAQVIQEYEYR
jgi:DNA polymerase elongation subunit (family B)